jgi:alpha-ketoglutarate-dependent taurine dioxygenase
MNLEKIVPAKDPQSEQQNFIDSNGLSHDMLIAAVKAQLSWRGWTVVENMHDKAKVLELLQSLGTLLPQYTGQLEYDVKSVPGFENFQYSQSANTIQPHTEAPVYTPPPKYLALYCQRQARCGNGHTLLADGFGFIQTLSNDLRAEVLTRPINFSGFRTPEKGAEEAPQVYSSVLSVSPKGEPILRFSYNVFRYNNLHPALDQESSDLFDGNDPFFRRMCAQVEDYFWQNKEAVLIPDSGILIFDNHRMLHARSKYTDHNRHLVRFWVGDEYSQIAQGVEE